MVKFVVHQKKGGIHAIYRSVMGNSGNSKLTECSKNICPAISGKPPAETGGFYFIETKMLNKRSN